MTKYPSILTYHELNRGGVINKLTEPGEMPFPGETLYITEKVDGENFRVITCGEGDYILGTREELIYWKGDKIKSEKVQRFPDMEFLDNLGFLGHEIRVYYGELYGDKIQQKRYQKSRERAWVVFDIADIIPEAYRAILSGNMESIAGKRERGEYQSWKSPDTLDDSMESEWFEQVPTLGEIDAADLPQDPAETLEWMQQWKETKAAIDDDLPKEGLYGKSEGVVIRNFDRSWIRKLRFEDYEKGQKKEWK